MKNPLLITLLFVVVLPVMGQKTKHSPTDDYLQTKDTTYLPKTPKNELSCDFELILSSNLTYKRRISDKIAIGVTGKLIGFAVGVPLFFKNSDLNYGLDVINFGLLMDYKISTRFYWEGTAQAIGFFDGVSDSFEITYSIFGLKNGIFFKFKHIDLGWNIFIGNVRQDTYGKPNGLAIYSSFLILRISLKNNN